MAGEFNPYIGAESQLRHMSFKKDYGGNILKHNAPQYNFYIGIRPIKNFGIEAGYEATNTRTRTTELHTGDLVNGVQIPADFSPITFKSKHKVRGPHINITGFYAPFNEDDTFELFGSVGISFNKHAFERENIRIKTLPISSIRIASDRKPILRFNIGFENMWTEYLGTRFSLGLQKTNQITIYANDGVKSLVIPVIQPKDSIIYGYGLGLFYKF